MKGKSTSLVAAAERRSPRLAPLAALLLLAGVSAWSQEGPSFAEETARIAEALELEPGLSVADVGAGKGEYAVFLANTVGLSGAVFATEVDEDRLRDIREAVSGRANVTVIRGEDDATAPPEQCCDRILLRRVYHHFKEPQAMLRAFGRRLRRAE